jgi:hypothetical protein
MVWTTGFGLKVTLRCGLGLGSSDGDEPEERRREASVKGLSIVR